MKTLLVIIFLAVASFFGYYALMLRTSMLQCNVVHQGSIERLVTQSQTVLADQRDACEQSYTVLTDWGLCADKADEAMPDAVRTTLRPIVSTFMMFFREKNKEVDVMKREHDERCKGYTELLFFPPDIE